MSSPADAGQAARWDTFVDRYHATHAGITEDLLGPALDSEGRNPYRWLADVLPPRGLVLDVACGSAALAELVDGDRYLGLDRSGHELAAARLRRPTARLVLGEAVAAPVRGRFDAVAVSMALMLLDLDALLARLTPLLPAGGVFAATVPVRALAPVSQPYRHLLELLDLIDRPFPEQLDPAWLAQRFRRAGFALRADELGSFARPLRDADDVTLVLESFYAVPNRAARLARSYLEDIGSADAALHYPVRRLVAHRL